MASKPHYSSTTRAKSTDRQNDIADQLQIFMQTKLGRNWASSGIVEKILIFFLLFAENKSGDDNILKKHTIVTLVKAEATNYR